VTIADDSTVMLRGSEDILLLVWYDQKQITGASSVDHGISWETSTLHKYNIAYNWMFSRAVTSADDVHILTAIGTQPTFPDSCNLLPTSLIVFRTDDNGKTWTNLRNVASHATFPCCGDTRDISPILTSDSMTKIDLLFFGNTTNDKCAILFISSKDSGITWSKPPVSLSFNTPQSYIDPALVTYAEDEVQLYWMDVSGSLWRRFSTDTGRMWTPAEQVTKINGQSALTSTHLDVAMDDQNLAHLVFSVSIQNNNTNFGTIYYVQQESLRHWYLKPLGLGLWITTVIVTILIVAGWFVLAKWKQTPSEYDKF